MSEQDKELIKGRGAQKAPHNRFLTNELVHEHWEAIDEEPDMDPGRTHFIANHPKTIVNKVASPDVGLSYSLNPYQGCEHGCIYCYARNSHEYWGYNAGIDFESKIMVKHNAPELLEKYLRKRGYEPHTISLSGNTDCYQPGERKFGITRKLLEVFLRYRHPVSIITKNSLITRDLDILSQLAERNLVSVAISITTLDNELHRKLEPRTAAPKQRLKAMEALSKAGIPVMLMNAPIIPGLNDHETPDILQASANAGAMEAGYIMVRLNGAIGGVFADWIEKAYPMKAQKVLHRIQDCHQGKLNDSRFGKRMKGDGNIAQMVADVFSLNKRKYFEGRSIPSLDKTQFRLPDKYGQLDLFG